MKKLFTLFVLFFAYQTFSQTTLKLWSLLPDQSDTVMRVNNGDEIFLTVAAGELKTEKFQMQNIGSTTNQYLIKRTNIVVNDSAEAYFCSGDQGNCYPAGTPLSTDYTTLAPGQSTSKNTGPPTFACTNLITDLDEDNSAAGYSVIQYKIFNNATGENGPDTLTFRIIYNKLLGVKENSSIITHAGDVYPNPSENNASLNISLNSQILVKTQVYNALGVVVYSNNETKTAGKNRISVDCSNLSSGLYFVTVTAGNSKITKRLVVNK